MTHKGYAARIEYDDADGLFIGRIAGNRDRISRTLATSTADGV
jgi:predicted HicB family RNase H-like nuclease